MSVASGTLWRITKSKHAQTAFNGRGARHSGGRWNSQGVAMVYTSETQALAALEMLVHLDQEDLLDAYTVFPIITADSLIRTVPASELPSNWKADPAPFELREIGDNWIRSSASVILRVPSALIPTESNYLINPAHPDFAKLRIGPKQPFHFDPRFRQ